MAEINFLETDIAVIRQQMKDDYEATFGETLYEGSPQALFIDWITYWRWHDNLMHKDFARQMLKKYAREPWLDTLIECIDGIERIRQAPAKIMLRFYVKENKAQTIPMGTLVTPDGKLYFKTTKTISITYFEENTEQGTVVQNTGDVLAECTLPGVVGNKIAANKEMEFIGLDNIEKVESITMSSGGTEKETDDEYYLRSLEESARYSTAGPLDAYEYLAKKAHEAVVDARATDQTGAIIIYIIVADEVGMSREEVARYVEDSINNGKKIPQNDKVTVEICEETSYDVNVDYYMGETAKTSQEEVEAEMRASIARFAEWTASKIGRALNPTKLRSDLYAAGAEHIQVIAPDEYSKKEFGRFVHSGKITLRKID